MWAKQLCCFLQSTCHWAFETDNLNIAAEPLLSMAYGTAVPNAVWTRFPRLLPFLHQVVGCFQLLSETRVRIFIKRNNRLVSEESNHRTSFQPSYIKSKGRRELFYPTDKR